jgi:hypothetical protein
LALTFQVSQAEPLFTTADTDTSLAHFPSKVLSDIPHLFITENGIPFIVGSFLTASDWALFDQQNPWKQDLRNLNIQPLFDFGNFYGEGWVEGGTALGSWSIGALTDDLRLQEFGRDACESLGASLIVVEGLKVSVNRTRPNGNSDSFPSGHSITAFCFAPVVAKYGGVELGIPAYALATVTALARVEGGYHYISDVIAGATLGIVIGNAVVYTPKDVSVSVGPGQVNLKLAFN